MKAGRKWQLKTAGWKFIHRMHLNCMYVLNEASQKEMSWPELSTKHGGSQEGILHFDCNPWQLSWSSQSDRARRRRRKKKVAGKWDCFQECSQTSQNHPLHEWLEQRLWLWCRSLRETQTHVGRLPVSLGSSPDHWCGVTRGAGALLDTRTCREGISHIGRRINPDYLWNFPGTKCIP